MLLYVLFQLRKELLLLRMQDLVHRQDKDEFLVDRCLDSNNELMNEIQGSVKGNCSDSNGVSL